MKFDVLIPAHGETVKQIETLLTCIHLQKTPNWRINDILLCSDRQRVSDAFFNRADLTFLRQKSRRGKPNALNMMLKNTSSDYCIQNSADCIPASEQTYGYLLRHFTKLTVGASTSKPISFNEGFMYLPNIVWACHDFVQPKISGELFAFMKSLIDEIPEDIIHDDAFIHNCILERGYEVVYEPRALVFNRVPATLQEFYSQRKKNVIGNMQLGDQFKVQPPRNMRLRSLILMGLELLANAHGRLDYLRGRIPKGLIGYNLESTKEVLK